MSEFQRYDEKNRDEEFVVDTPESGLFDEFKQSEETKRINEINAYERRARAPKKRGVKKSVAILSLVTLGAIVTVAVAASLSLVTFFMKPDDKFNLYYTFGGELYDTYFAENTEGYCLLTSENGFQLYLAPRPDEENFIDLNSLPADNYSLKVMVFNTADSADMPETIYEQKVYIEGLLPKYEFSVYKDGSAAYFALEGDLSFYDSFDLVIYNDNEWQSYMIESFAEHFYVDLASFASGEYKAEIRGNALKGETVYNNLLYSTEFTV